MASTPNSFPGQPVNCPCCGFGNAAGDRYCGGCGNPLDAGGAGPNPSMLCAYDGSVLRWGDADTPLPPAVTRPGAPASVTIAVSPVRPGHSVTVEYRVDGGPVRQALGAFEPPVHDANARVFRAVLPGQPSGTVEFLPVLRFAGQPISPRLGESPECRRYQVSRSGAGVKAADTPATPSAEFAGEPRWHWHTRFLWTGTVGIRKEVVGALPDGLRINWHVTEGRFVGPHLEAVVLPGAADWMRIREDGIGIVSVTECLQTQKGALLYCSYGGIFDLGVDGYSRALRGEFDPSPPFVVAPTYTTADEELAWLNRIQCLGVGRVDMKERRAVYDVYIVGVGGCRHAG